MFGMASRHKRTDCFCRRRKRTTHVSKTALKVVREHVPTRTQKINNGRRQAVSDGVAAPGVSVMVCYCLELQSLGDNVRDPDVPNTTSKQTNPFIEISIKRKVEASQ